MEQEQPVHDGPQLEKSTGSGYTPHHLGIRIVYHWEFKSTERDISQSPPKQHLPASVFHQEILFEKFLGKQSSYRRDGRPLRRIGILATVFGERVVAILCPAKTHRRNRASS